MPFAAPAQVATVLGSVSSPIQLNVGCSARACNAGCSLTYRSTCFGPFHRTTPLPGSSLDAVPIVMTRRKQSTHLVAVDTDRHETSGLITGRPPGQVRPGPRAPRGGGRAGPRARPEEEAPAVPLPGLTLDPCLPRDRDPDVGVQYAEQE